MADVRSLLKAKRQESRINHPYATYTPSDQLKCSICSTVIKHASAWEGHLGSKAHRMAVARVRQQQQQVELEAATAAASLHDHDGDEQPETSMSAEARGKRKASVSSVDLESKKRRTTAQDSGFPADFFSDPTRQLPMPNDDDDEEGDDEDGMDNAMAVDSAHPAAPPTSEKSAVDEEYERFQRELLQLQTASSSNAVANKHEAYARATISSEEQLFSEAHKSGFDHLGDGNGTTQADNGDGEQEAEVTEEEKTRQRDRELIMDQLLEEERLQEDADMRVASMKARMEALKRKREARKAAAAAKAGS